MEEMKYGNQTLPDEICFSLNDDSPINDTEVIRMLVKAKREGTILSGYCSKGLSTGDLEIELSKNMKGIIPRNEVTYKVEKDGEVHLGKCSGRVGMNVQFKVKDIKEENGDFQIILSRKDAVEEVKNRYINELKEGMIVKGVVTGIQSWGAFVDIGGDVDGIISVGDVARVFINNPSEVLSIGEIVEVLIDRIEEVELNNGEKTIHLVLNRKSLMPSFSEIEKYYRAGETVPGRVKKIIDSGIFVELNESFEGLADFTVDENGNTRKFNYGEKIRVKIHSINMEKEKIRLRILV